jgi:hypothetical protein
MQLCSIHFVRKSGNCMGPCARHRLGVIQISFPRRVSEVCIEKCSIIRPIVFRGLKSYMCTPLCERKEKRLGTCEGVDTGTSLEQHRYGQGASWEVCTCNPKGQKASFCSCVALSSTGRWACPFSLEPQKSFPGFTSAKAPAAVGTLH